MPWLAWKELFSGDSGFFIAVIKAHVHFFKWLFFDKKTIVFPVKENMHSKWMVQWIYSLAIFYKKKKNVFRNCWVTNNFF